MPRQRCRPADKLKVLRLIKAQAAGFVVPSVTVISRRKDPFRVLISCILSLRTQDKTTSLAAGRLFKAADTPAKMLFFSAPRIRKLIYPVGFYRTKAKIILGISKALVEDFAGQVPRRQEELLRLKGVGLKTANLVLGLAYHIPAICVDTHVHRISNRLGWIDTKTPEESEGKLRRLFPRRYWISLNTILVTFGQNICLPVSPFCSRCRVYRFCLRKGVARSR